MDDKKLEELAVQELLKEAQRGKERSQTMGPAGWNKRKIPTTNKRFLQRTVNSAIYFQKRKEVTPRINIKNNLIKHKKHLKNGKVSSKNENTTCKNKSTYVQHFHPYKKVEEKMIKDRLPDLLELARSDPDKYNEPEQHEEVPIDPDLLRVLDRADKVKKYFKDMEYMLVTLEHKHQSILTSVSVIQENICREQIKRIMNRFTALAKKSKKILERIELKQSEYLKYFCNVGSPTRDLSVKWEQKTSSVQDDPTCFNWTIFNASPSKINVSWNRINLSVLLSMSNFNSVPASMRMQLLLHSVLSYRLTELVGKYYTAQKIYNDLSRKKIERQKSISGQSIDKEEIEKAIDSGERVPLLYSEILNEKQISKEMRKELQELEYFELEILSIERNIHKLHESFLVVSQLVHDQGEVVDRIHHHVELGSNYVEASNIHLKKAVKAQHKYRKKKCVIAFLVVLLLAIIAIIIYFSVQKQRQQHTAVSISPPVRAHLRPS